MKKTIALLLTGILTTMMVTGCGGNTDSSGGNAKTDPAKDEAVKTETVQTEDAKQEAASGEKTILKFACWDYENPGYDKALIEAFMEKYPEYEVQVYDIPSKEYPTKVAVMLAGDEDIDVFYSKNAQMYSSLVSKNQIMDLTDLIAQNQVDTASYGDVLGELTIDGKLYGLNYRSDSMLLYYNNQRCTRGTNKIKKKR